MPSLLLTSLPLVTNHFQHWLFALVLTLLSNIIFFDFFLWPCSLTISYVLLLCFPIMFALGLLVVLFCLVFLFCCLIKHRGQSLADYYRWARSGLQPVLRKFYWHIVMCIRVVLISGYFCAVTTEIRTWDRDCSPLSAPNQKCCCLALREKVCQPLTADNTSVRSFPSRKSGTLSPLSPQPHSSSLDDLLWDEVMLDLGES